MPNIKITVAGKIATNTTPGVAIVCGNSDYTVTFDLDDEWAAEAARTARFVYYKDGLRIYKDVEFTGDTAAVPVLSGIDNVMVGVYAGDLHTTTPAQVLCDRSILCGDAVEQITREEKAGMQAQIGDLSQLQTTAKGNLVEAINEAAKTGSGAGGTGKDGEDGGYYTPAVTKPDDETIQFDFTPSKTGMPAVAAARVKLPVGSGTGVEEVVISSEEPTDENAKIWINPDEEDEESGGGTSINVTAEVGQTIIVKAVDENGKPTEWKAAEYPLKQTEIIPRTTFTPSFDELFGGYTYSFKAYDKMTEGRAYAVLFDGVEYVCTAKAAAYNGINLVYIGNGALIGENTGEPFVIASFIGEAGYINLLCFDGNNHTVRLSVLEVDDSYIPQSAYINYINVTGSGTTGDPYVFDITYPELLSLLKRGCDVKLWMTHDDIIVIYMIGPIMVGSGGYLIINFIPTWGNINLALTTTDGITLTHIED